MKSDDLDTVALLKELLTINTVEEDPAETRQRLTLDFASLQRLLWSMDSEYDRKVTKGLLSALLPRQKLYHLGMKPDRVVANLQTIINTSQEAENAVSAAEDMVHPFSANRDFRCRTTCTHCFLHIVVQLRPEI